MQIQQFNFSPAQQQKALRWLVFWHMIVIISSNYLVQICFTLFGLHTTWGAFTFPFIFLTTDLTVRIFGAALARKIIFFSMIPALFISYFIGVLFLNGEFTGFAALSSLNTVVARIALASLLGYLIGQIMAISAEHWTEIALMDYAWKLSISIVLFLPAYGILLKILSDKLTRISKDHTANLSQAGAYSS